jgi:MFS family permease
MTTATPEAPATSTYPSLWRNRSFNLLWGSQTLSDLGSTMSYLAFPLLVLALTGSPVKAGLVGTIAAIAKAVVRLPAGVLIDQVNRRTAMLTCDAVRIVAFVGLGLLILTHHVTLPLIIVTALIEAVANVVFGTAETSALRNIVPLAQLPGAVARNEGRTAATGLVGPPIGGALFGVARAIPFLADAVSYVLSFIGVILIRERFEEERTQKSAGVVADLSEGITFVLREPFLRAALLVAAPMNFGFSGLLFAVILVLQRHGTAPALIGSVDTIIGISALLGAICAPWIQKRIGVRTLVMSVAWSAAVLVALAAPLSGSILIAVPIALSLFLAPSINAALFGYQAAITPDRLQGRVMSIVFMVALSLATFAPIAAGFSVGWLGGPGTVLVFAGSLAVAALVTTVSNGMRQMRPIEELIAA